MLIEEGIYRAVLPIPGWPKTVNSYLLKDGRDAFLIDTGCPDAQAGERLMALLSEASVKPENLTGIILTHSHIDHIGGLAELQRMSGAPTLIYHDEIPAHHAFSRRDRSWQETMQAWFVDHGTSAAVALEMLRPMLQFPFLDLGTTGLLTDGEIIRCGAQRWQVIWTPGHAQGHIALWERSRGVLLAGDHVLPSEAPNVSLFPDLTANPLGLYLESLRRLRCLGVRLALPGHGEPFTNFEDVVARLIAHHEIRAADVIEALQAGQCSAFAVACSIPWVQRSRGFLDLQPMQRFLAMGETIAHLERLADRGDVRRLTLAGKTAWRLTTA